MIIYKRVCVYIVLVIFIIAVGISGYQIGKQQSFEFNKSFQQVRQDEVLNCPYKIKGSEFINYTDVYSEAKVVGRPKLIENPEVIKIREPFNLAEFEKNLYKLSDHKGWDERRFDVDGDNKEEIIISANLAMNHTPHIALIVKDGFVIFRDEGVNIWIERSYGGKGFTLSRTVGYWGDGEKEITRYIPKDGGFMPIWTQKSCLVYFE